MELKKYLYGAAVQGIQDFIFQSNKLKYIVGASGLVETICRNEFDEFVREGELIVKAAGNIKCIFNTKEACEKAVLYFPLKIMEMAPGITISQAVVLYDPEAKNGFSTAVEELEAKLKVQRNRPVSSVTLGFMGVVRSRTTGLPAIAVDKEGEFVDEALYSKKSNSEVTRKLCKSCFGIDLSHDEITYQVNKIPSGNNWLAIIHADGNGLGKILQRIGHNKEKLKIFSSALDQCTVKAAQDAYNALDKKAFTDRIPIRPVILGGDDFTMICRADIAMQYTTEFLRNFEVQTAGMLADHFKDEELEKLTACAGIAFIKTTYPFHYGYKLAEELCGYAKKNAEIKNGLASSCLMFHKVQDSFIDTYEQIRHRELTTKDSVSLCYGPYYLDDNKQNSINKLQERVELLKTSEKTEKNHLRGWIDALYVDKESARQRVEYRKKTLSDPGNDLLLQWTNLENNKTPVYDILSLSSIMSDKSKSTADE